MAQKEAFFAPAERLHSVCMLLVLRRVTTLRERRKRVSFLLKRVSPYVCPEPVLVNRSF